MTDRTDARDFMIVAAQFCRDELDNAQDANFPCTVQGITDTLAAIPSATSQEIRNRIGNSLAARRAAQSEVLSGGCRELMDAALDHWGRVINSPNAGGDREALFGDISDDIVTATEKIASRGISAASDPAPADGLLLRRLTVDHRGQNIEGGIHCETVTAEVKQTGLTGQGPRQALVLIYGEEAADDSLDYQTGGTAHLADIELELYNEVKISGAVQNSNFTVSGAPSNGDAVTSSNLASWKLSNVENTPTVVYRNTDNWRSTTGGVAVSTNVTTKRFEQSLILPPPVNGGESAYVPIDILCVVYWDGTWAGKVREYWGSRSEEFSSGAFSGAGFKYLLPTQDKYLYPVNFTTTSPVIGIEVETDSASGELVVRHLDLQRRVRRQGYWYCAWSHTNDPAEGVTKTWADTVTFTRGIQDILQMLYGQASWAYLPTSGAGPLLAFASRAPEIGVTRNGSNVADGGTVALGSVATGAHAVTFVFANTGNAPLALVEPTNGSNTNISSVTTDMGGPIVVPANDTRTIVVTVTDAGAGAFSTTIDFTNNDASESTYAITISGTAT